MSKKTSLVHEGIVLGKFVHGGQVMASLPSGKTIFVWGGLPGEVVNVRETSKKRNYIEGIVSEVVKPSKSRIEPLEPKSYLSTSPWQIMSLNSENSAKHSILEEAFEREGLGDVSFSPFVHVIIDRHDSEVDSHNKEVDKNVDISREGFGYRNKVEFGFWGDEQGIHLAHYVRGTHGKQIVTGNSLAMSKMNEVITNFIIMINRWTEEKGLRAGDLKTVVFRASQSGEVVSALFIKKEINIDKLDLPEAIKGVVIYYSDPKSPASVTTKKLYSLGDITLTDTVLGKNITYDVLSFFQVNLPVFELALKEIKTYVDGDTSVDFYSGVGTIGIPVGSSILVESDQNNIEMAKYNAAKTKTKVIHAASEKALEHIADDKILIVDPPRAGLHSSVIDKIIEKLPPKVIYLSCNPSTQARDVKYLSELYKVVHAQGYNFFPRTPHIESLIVLELK